MTADTAPIYECVECIWMGMEEDTDDDSQKWLVCPECGANIKLLTENPRDSVET